MASGSVRPRPLALTAAHLAKVARDVPKVERASKYRQMTDAEMEALAHRLLEEIGTEPFWVFAYGSLIWKPAFEYVEARRCVTHGWRRQFCMQIVNYRATPEQPGLMLALERGGACTGVAYRMPDDARHDRMMRLLRREISSHEDVRTTRWLNMRARGEVFRALTFYCMPPDDPIFIRLSLDEQAAVLARAVGYVGSCAEYLHNTVTHLEDLGFRDSYLWSLQAKVAAEIDRLEQG